MPVFKHIDQPVNDYNKANPCGLKYVDHCVGNVEEGKMNHWVEWYETSSSSRCSSTSTTPTSRPSTRP
jgi:4-hydroxyphenylpyruvate dioxygenase-like putative hemolysin